MLLIEMLLDREPLLNGMMVVFFRGGGTGRDTGSSGPKKLDQGRSRAVAAKGQKQKDDLKCSMKPKSMKITDSMMKQNMCFIIICFFFFYTKCFINIVSAAVAQYHSLHLKIYSYKIQTYDL